MIGATDRSIGYGGGLPTKQALLALERGQRGFCCELFTRRDFLTTTASDFASGCEQRSWRGFKTSGAALGACRWLDRFAGRSPTRCFGTAWPAAIRCAIAWSCGRASRRTDRGCRRRCRWMIARDEFANMVARGRGRDRRGARLHGEARRRWASSRAPPITTASSRAASSRRSAAPERCRRDNARVRLAWCRARTCRSATSTSTRASPPCRSRRRAASRRLHLRVRQRTASTGDGARSAACRFPIKRDRGARGLPRAARAVSSGSGSAGAHRQHPFIAVWDDHEFANNAWSGGAENHNRTGEGEWMRGGRGDSGVARMDADSRDARRCADLSPVSQFAFGDLADLMMLDTRIDRPRRAGARDDRARSSRASRQLLGAEQEGWLRRFAIRPPPSRRGRSSASR